MTGKLLPRANRVRASGGSLVVCVLTPAAAYLAADSRYLNAGAALKDSAEKLIAVERTALCALSGYIRFTRTFGTAIDGAELESTILLSSIVREADRARPNDGDVDPSAFAERLFTRLQSIWDAVACDLDQPFGRGVGSRQPLAKLLYLDRRADGEATLLVIELDHAFTRSENRYTSTLLPMTVRPVYRGMIVSPMAFVIGAEPGCVVRDPGQIDGEGRALAFMAELFAASQHDPGLRARVGGPIDIAVIDAEGRKWLQRKPSRSIAS